MMKARLLRPAGALAAFLFASGGIPLEGCPGREPDPQFAQVTIQAGREGCVLELDAAPAGKTDSHGTLTLEQVEPGNHYLHVRCPEQQERVYFIALRVGERVEIRHDAGGAPAVEANPASMEAAQVKVRLRELVQQAVRVRARGRFEEAVRLLREAAKLDPENSDLHRELGITFLLSKDWPRARVEMLEAIRHQPDDADAHNGLGYALEKLGKLEAALKEYRIATHLEPDNTSYRQHYLEAIGKLAALKAEKKK